MATAKQPTGEAAAPERLQGDHPTLTLLRKKWRRLNVNNEHWMLCIVGREGSGKSYASIKIGRMVDPNFSADNIYFHPAAILEDLRDGNYQAGDVWVLDESGVGLGNRTWHDSGQVMLNQALQLIRNHNIGLIFTLPVLSDLDSQATGRLQNALELVTKHDGEYVRGKWWESEVDRMGFSKRSNGVWWDHEVINGHRLRTIALTPPESEIVERYEDAKAEFQEQFYDETIEELRSSSGDTEGEQESPEEIVEGLNKGIAGLARRTQ
jgi:ABC-type dipeptide/oligopeptide/nickel transport system ATPase component